MINSSYDKIKEKIEGFRNLGEDWLCYYDKIEEVAIVNALNFLTYLKENNISIFFVCPTPCRGVGFEFRNKEKCVDIIVECKYNGDIYYCYLQNGKTKSKGDLTPEMYFEIFKLLI